jgi:mono/diheme cytochrome c family protein
MASSRIVKVSVIAGVFLACLPAIFATSGFTGAVAAEDGGAVYGQKCAGCHGKDGKGTAMWKSKGQPDFTDPKFQSSVTDQQISASIHDGKGKFMPAFKGKLSDQQIASLVAQVRAFGKR